MADALAANPLLASMQGVGMPGSGASMGMAGMSAPSSMAGGMPGMAGGMPGVPGSPQPQAYGAVQQAPGGAAFGSTGTQMLDEATIQAQKNKAVEILKAQRQAALDQAVKMHEYKRQLIQFE